MTADSRPAKETLRLAKLQGYNVLDTLPEQVYDDITSLAAHICQTPTALISLIDADRQWFKSKVGMEVNETPRSVAFCNQTIQRKGVLVVEDARQDERFSSNPLVTGEPHIRFYAGAPLITPDGYALGSLCVIDYQPRQLSAPQLHGLLVLSRQVVAQLELIYRANQLKSSNDLLEHRVNERTSGLTSALHRLLKAQTKLLKREAALRHSALHDPLTGLPNRSYFSQRLDQAIQLARRQPEHLYAVLFLDLDEFKQVNDALGHEVGDQLLKYVAEQIKLLLRKSDLVARLGGDEFAVLLDDIPDEEHVIVVVQRLQEQLRVPFLVGDRQISIAASVGITFSNQGYEHPEAAIRDADVAMYRAKARAKQQAKAKIQAQLEQHKLALKSPEDDSEPLKSPILIQEDATDSAQRFVVFDAAAQEGDQTRLVLESELRQALERGEFHLHYQPIFSLESPTIKGFEVLLRWHHPQRGCLRASDFIAIASEIGILLELCQQIVQTACWQLKKWQDCSPTSDLQMHLNLSLVQIRCPQLVEYWRSVLAEYQLSPSAFLLEIEEQVLLSSDPTIMAALQQLHSLGLGLCVDDFGLGHSSLSRLHQLNVGALKIDRTFVKAIDSAGGTEIIKTIIDLGRSSKMNVIAEGIETQQQLKTMVSLGCPLGQGFLLGKPLEAIEIDEMLCHESPSKRFSSDQ